MFPAVRGEICVAKAQLELNLASTVKDSPISLRNENNAAQRNSSHGHTLSQVQTKEKANTVNSLNTCSSQPALLVTPKCEFLYFISC